MIDEALAKSSSKRNKRKATMLAPRILALLLLKSAAASGCPDRLQAARRAAMLMLGA